MLELFQNLGLGFSVVFQFVREVEHRSFAKLPQHGVAMFLVVISLRETTSSGLAHKVGVRKRTR